MSVRNSLIPVALMLGTFFPLWMEKGNAQGLIDPWMQGTENRDAVSSNTIDLNTTSRNTVSQDDSPGRSFSELSGEPIGRDRNHPSARFVLNRSTEVAKPIPAESSISFSSNDVSKIGNSAGGQNTPRQAYDSPPQENSAGTVVFRPYKRSAEEASNQELQVRYRSESSDNPLPNVPDGGRLEIPEVELGRPDLQSVAKPAAQADYGITSPQEKGLSSYSFDSREWVEFFPTDANPATSAASTSQTTSKPVAFATVNRYETAPPPSKDDPFTSLKPLDERLISIEEKIASKIVVAPERSAADVPKPLDLTPSYSKHLKYSKVCGVVVVQSNFPLTEIESILNEIEQLQRDLNLYMAVPSPKEKIELCLFKDEKTYKKFLGDVFPKAPTDRRALYVKLDNKPGTLLVQRSKEFEIDLRHEMTHAIIHASIAIVPIWLDEGLAKYFEPPIADRANKNPYLKQIKWNTKFGAVPSLSRLEKLEHIGEMGGREYRDSWAWVHFLIHHSPQTHRLLAGYLQLLATLPADGKEPVVIPSLSLYIKDVIDNPRDKYREHYRIWASADSDLDN